jgi:hypothetical protein
VVVGRSVPVVGLQEFSRLVRQVRLVWGRAVEVTWRTKSRSIGVDALSWQVSRRDSTRS